MTWEFSHSPEAYEAMRENISKQSREWLETVWSEIQARSSREEHEGGFNETVFNDSMKLAKSISDESLAESIYDFAMEQRECSNGGFEAYCCPFHCGCHTVSMDQTEGG